MKNSLGFLSTVMLGIVALLGTSGVQAVINLDATEKGTAAVTYAKETLSSASTRTVKMDSATYYTVDGGADLLDVQGSMKIGTSGTSTIVVKYVLDGMVFTANAPTLNIDTTASCSASNGSSIDVRAGGQSGDSSVTFTVSSGADVDVGDVACLRLEDVALASGMSGGITMTVTDDLPLPDTYSKSYSGAVRAVNALMPTATRVNPTALVSTNFMSFDTGPDDTAAQWASVGSFMVGADEALLNAVGGVVVMLADVVTADGATAGVVDDGSSTVAVEGDFSFASKVTWAAMGTNHACDGESTDNLLTDDGTVETQTLATVNMRANLCITVRNTEDEDAMPIPETDPYMVMTKYVSPLGDDAAFPPARGTHELGYIMRDGTTVQIPYLTTYPPYNQRIVIRNRSGVAAAYQLAFKAEDDAMATPGADAEGMLPANSVIYLSMMNNDVVTLTDTFRVAATLTVVSEPRHIDVIVSQTNEGGSTDSMVLTTTD